MLKEIVYLTVLIGLLACHTDQRPITGKSAQVVDSPIGMVCIQGGTYLQGGKSEQSKANELPRHRVTVSPFHMDITEVTNAQFQKFVEETRYTTVAEQKLDWEVLSSQVPAGTPAPPDSLLQPGALVFKPTDGPVNLDRYDLWWKWTIGADWQHPSGPDSDISDRDNHPVVHIAHTDAVRYCQWLNKRLPTEAEWEWAANGGDDNNKYPWGSEPIAEANNKANFWQGIFPYLNTRKDGYVSTAPVQTYPPNGYGLYDMGGNVWEWCADRYASDYYNTINEQQSLSNPQGPEYSRNLEDPYGQNAYVIKGGSFLCNDSYCSGYRVARRSGKDADSGSDHTGFRCVQDVQPK